MVKLPKVPQAFQLELCPHRILLSNEGAQWVARMENINQPLGKPTYTEYLGSKPRKLEDACFALWLPRFPRNVLWREVPNQGPWS